MTLEQIEGRLNIFHEYLTYLIEHRIKNYPRKLFLINTVDDTNEDLRKRYRKTGWMFVSVHRIIPEYLMDFDVWLGYNGHSDLLESFTIYMPAGLIEALRKIGPIKYVNISS